MVKYTFNNVGNTFSAKSISDYLKAEHRALDNETVYSYLEKLEKAYLLHRCSRYDLQGKEILKTQEKFYLADTSLRYSVLGYNADSVATSLENVVYLELCRRGYAVNIGKTSDGEIDFVATRQNEKVYVQVTQQIASEKQSAESTSACWRSVTTIPNMCSEPMNLQVETMKASRRCTWPISCCLTSSDKLPSTKLYPNCEKAGLHFAAPL